MEDPVALAKAAVEGFMQDAEFLGTGTLDILREKIDGVIDQLAQRLATERVELREEIDSLRSSYSRYADQVASLPGTQLVGKGGQLRPITLEDLEILRQKIGLERQRQTADPGQSAEWEAGLLTKEQAAKTPDIGYKELAAAGHVALSPTLKNGVTHRYPGEPFPPARQQIDTPSSSIRPLTAAESLPVLYPLPGTVKS